MNTRLSWSAALLSLAALMATAAPGTPGAAAQEQPAAPPPAPAAPPAPATPEARLQQLGQEITRLKTQERAAMEKIAEHSTKIAEHLGTMRERQQAARNDILQQSQSRRPNLNAGRADLRAAQDAQNKATAAGRERAKVAATLADVQAQLGTVYLQVADIYVQQDKKKEAVQLLRQLIGSHGSQQVRAAAQKQLNALGVKK